MTSVASDDRRSERRKNSDEGTSKLEIITFVILEKCRWSPQVCYLGNEKHDLSLDTRSIRYDILRGVRIIRRGG